MEWRCGRLDIDRRLWQQRQRRCDCGLLSRKRHVERRDVIIERVGADGVRLTGRLCDGDAGRRRAADEKIN